MGKINICTTAGFRPLPCPSIGQADSQTALPAPQRTHCCTCGGSRRYLGLPKEASRLPGREALRCHPWAGWATCILSSGCLCSSPNATVPGRSETSPTKCRPRPSRTSNSDGADAQIDPSLERGSPAIVLCKLHAVDLCCFHRPCTSRWNGKPCAFLLEDPNRLSLFSRPSHAWEELFVLQGTFLHSLHA